VIECVSDNDMGSSGVTVLGIALTAIRSMGNDFIDVILNNDPISLFNSHKHTIMDVLLQAGINPSLLISKNGKSVRFNYNGCKRIVFGEYGTNAKIRINGEEATLETEVKANDNIILEYAQNGKDASPKLSENIRNINSVSIYLDDNIMNIEPVTLVNEKREELDYIIKNGDEIRVFLPCKVNEFKKYILKEEVILLKGGEYLEDNYEILEGDHIVIKAMDSHIGHEEAAKVNDREDYVDVIESENIEGCNEESENINSDKIEIAIGREEFRNITVNINGENIVLKGKVQYLIVDIFEYIDFDLTVPKGIINLNLNGEKAPYTANIKDGDIIEVFWSDN
jgi:molybdopterin converting factor small subunit